MGRYFKFRKTREVSSEREIPIRMSHYLGCLSKPAGFPRESSKGKRNAGDLISHYNLFDPETTKLTIVYIHPNNDLLRHIPLLSYTASSGVSRPDEDYLGRGSSGRENQPEGTKCPSLQITEIMNWASPSHILLIKS